jgi:hypothetical protein
MARNLRVICADLGRAVHRACVPRGGLPGEPAHHEHLLHPCSLSTHAERCRRRSPRGHGLSPVLPRESILIISSLSTHAHFQPMANLSFGDVPVDTALHRSFGGRASSSPPFSATLPTFNPWATQCTLCTHAHLPPMFTFQPWSTLRGLGQLTSGEGASWVLLNKY